MKLSPWVVMGKKGERITTPISRITKLANKLGLRLRSLSPGLTLIEIIITVAIIGLIMGLSAGVFYDASESRLSDTANQLAGTIRYVYNEAAIKNQYYRLVVDLGEQSFSVESSTAPFKIAATEEGTSPPPGESEVKKEEPPPSSDENSTTNPEKSSKNASKPPPSTKFVAVRSYLLKPIKLPEGIRIKDVYVAHLEKKIEAGKTAIYFFPNGWVEKSVINLSDEKGDTFYSLETFSTTGKTKIRTEYLDYKPEEEKL